MRLPLFQVDAFADQPFRGNPAAVCPPEEWLPDEIMQNIASENNLSETAFFVRERNRFGLRWFTPEVEVDLCGHATLAAAWIIITELADPPSALAFDTRSGELRVDQHGDELVMDLPLVNPEPCVPPAALLPGLGLTDAIVLAAHDFIVVVEDEATVKSLTPDFSRLLDKLPSAEILDNLGLKVVVENGPLLERFSAQIFRTTDGNIIANQFVITAALKKVK